MRAFLLTRPLISSVIILAKMNRDMLRFRSYVQRAKVAIHLFLIEHKVLVQNTFKSVASDAIKTANAFHCRSVFLLKFTVVRYCNEMYCKSPKTSY